MISEPFATGTSSIHHLDPRLRIVAATVFTTLVAVAENETALIASALVAVALAAVARLPLGAVIKRLLVVMGFVALIWLILPLTFEGAVAARWGPFSFYLPGVMLAAQITLKSFTILLSLMALVATMPLATLGHALQRLRVSTKIVHLLLMTYRYIFVIEAEYHRLRRAAKIRGFQARTNMHTYRTYAYFVGVLFVRATERAERVMQAMLCRGFKGQYYCLSEYDKHPGNWLFAGCMAAAAMGLVVLEWGHIVGI